MNSEQRFKQTKQFLEKKSNDCVLTHEGVFYFFSLLKSCFPEDKMPTIEHYRDLITLYSIIVESIRYSIRNSDTDNAIETIRILFESGNQKFLFSPLPDQNVRMAYFELSPLFFFSNRFWKQIICDDSFFQDKNVFVGFKSWLDKSWEIQEEKIKSVDNQHLQYYEFSAYYITSFFLLLPFWSSNIQKLFFRFQEFINLNKGFAYLIAYIAVYIKIKGSYIIEGDLSYNFADYKCFTDILTQAEKSLVKNESGGTLGYCSEFAKMIKDIIDSRIDDSHDGNYINYSDCIDMGYEDISVSIDVAQSPMQKLFEAVFKSGDL